MVSILEIIKYMATLMGHDIGQEVLDALGLKDKYIKSIVIRIETDEAVLIETRGYASMDQVNAIADIVRRYNLVKLEDGENS
jgi:hypothetical protein